MSVAISRRRFTADDYQRIGQAGILSEDDRVELIDGEILSMSPIGTRHCASVDRATRAMVTRAGDKAIVRVQGAVRLDFYNEPEPDLVLLRPRADFYASFHPGPADILLIVEVADSSIDYDRKVKGQIYARMGVAEYWLADLNEHVLSCYSVPGRDAYADLRQYQRGQSVAPLLLPECVIAVDDLIG
ncbi:MAG: Uma2 family endonuclease [Vicinamibacterales bacterium]